MFFKTLSFIFIAMMTLFLLWAIGWLWFATSVALASPKEGNIKTDAIVVLTGGNGRINEGLDLLAKGSSDKLFISGVNKEVTQDDIYAGWKKPTKDRPCCIYLGYDAEDTTGNAVETKNWILKNKISSFRLVTSSYHMPRAYLEMSKILPDIKIIPHPVLTDDFEAWKGRFWKLTFSEYNKMLVRWLNLNEKANVPA
ncbi:MAG TPA: YdcF family protein [Alphaproteobacteria bacterium]|nr:YdcF family protein [Alphaproteobacteria bacterium]